MITEMTRFQGIETNLFFVPLKKSLITEMTRFQGIETHFHKYPLLALNMHYRNDPIPGDWNPLVLFRLHQEWITEMTRFQGIETPSCLANSLNSCLITEMTRFQGIETQIEP